MTILSAPQDYQGVSNEMLFVVNQPSTPEANPDYKYVLDIYVDGNMVARLKAYPHPAYSFGVFDVSTVLRNYVPGYAMKAVFANIIETYETDLAYQVKIGEEYGGTLYTNVLTDSVRAASRTYITNRSILVPESDKNGKWFSNMPDVLNAYKSDRFHLFPVYTDESIQIEYSLYNSAVYVDGSDYSVGDFYKIVQRNFGFKRLAADFGLTTAQQNSIERLELTIDLSQQKTIYYHCPQYPVHTLAWLNPYGAYESYSFGFVSKQSIEVSRKDYQSLPYDINASGVVGYSENGVAYGDRKGFFATYKTQLNLTSHILSDDEYAWLSELFASPQVFIYDEEADVWYPVIISDTNYELRTFKNSRLTPLEFSVNFTNTVNTQYL